MALGAGLSGNGGQQVVPAGDLPATVVYNNQPNTFTQAQTLPVLDTGGAVYNVKAYGATGGGSVDDGVAIASAIAAAAAAGGGVVRFPAGTYKVTSSQRKDTITAVGGTGNKTFSDTSAVAGDVGSYVIGATQTGALQIVAVVPGVSFTTDYAPGNLTPGTVLVVKPGVVLHEGVQLVGSGDFVTNNNWSSAEAAASRILDVGTGVAVLVRGSYVTPAGPAGQYGLKGLSIWGFSGTAQWGVYVADGAQFGFIEQCDVGGFRTAGMAWDGNVNFWRVSDCLIFQNGTAAATTQTGGVITHPFWAQPSNSLIFKNTFFYQNWGCGIQDGTSVGCYGVTLEECQFDINSGSAATQQGIGAVLMGGVYGTCTVIGGWTENSGTYDYMVYGQGVTFIGTTMSYYTGGGGLTTAYHVSVYQYAQCNFIGCTFEGLAGNSILLGTGAAISWQGCLFGDGGIPWTGCGFTNSTAPMLGTSAAGRFTAAGTTIDNSGNVTAAGNIAALGGSIYGLYSIVPGNPGGGYTARSNIYSGSGAPSNTYGNSGDYYFRTDTPGTLAQRLYVMSAGAWTSTESLLAPAASPTFTGTVSSAGNLDITTVGKGVLVKEGTNAKQGTATLVTGTVTVANTSVTANSRIFLTVQALSGAATVQAVGVTARTAGTSFTITSASALDTSVIAYEIFEPG